MKLNYIFILSIFLFLSVITSSSPSPSTIRNLDHFGSKYESISILITQITENWPLIIEDFDRLPLSSTKYSLMKGNFSSYESKFSLKFNFNIKSQNFDETMLLNFKLLSIPTSIHSKLLTQMHTLDSGMNYGFTAYDILYTPITSSNVFDFVIIFIEYEEDIARYHTITLLLKANIPFKDSNNIISVNESTSYNFFPFSDKCITELTTTTAEYEVDALSKYFQMITLKKFAELFGTTESLDYPSF